MRLIKNIGLIGFGTIGKHIYKAVETVDDLKIQFVLRKSIIDNDIVDGGNFTCKLKDTDLEGLDLVVEAANAEVAKKYSEIVLKKTDFLIFSVTAFSDSLFLEKALKICDDFNTRIFIPHGSILGLDGIYDYRRFLESVHITSIKTPSGFGRKDEDKTVLYEGSTRNACKLFPRNVNVHAALAMAGAGFDRTQSTIIADPDIEGNTHIITVEGKGTKIKIFIQSQPKAQITGVYTPESAFGSVRRALLHRDRVCVV